MTSRADGLFELSDALLSHVGQVDSLPHLSLEPGFGRGHGMVYQALTVAIAQIRIPVTAAGRAWWSVRRWPR
ncbi:MAG TPA: hypothetical protein VHG10_15305 [Glycomyces sp.]|nr:hypothetical protein [Glycomyces sp.]